MSAVVAAAAVSVISFARISLSFFNPSLSIFFFFLNMFFIVHMRKASAELSRQGFHAEAKALMLEKTKLQGIKERALVRLEAKKKFKAGYDPANHYMRGKSVATWSGKKGMVA